MDVTLNAVGVRGGTLYQTKLNLTQRPDGTWHATNFGDALKQAHSAGKGTQARSRDTYEVEEAVRNGLSDEELAELAGVNLEQYADEMFSHGGDVSGKTAAEVFNGDYKIFTSGDVRFGVGQGSYMTEKNRKAAQALVGPYLPEARVKQGLDYIFYMFTDVRNSSTELLMAGSGAETLIKTAFDTEVVDGIATLPGVVSRKKQMIPRLINAIKQEQE